MSDFLQLAGKRIVVFGAANRKSVAFVVGRVLEEAGAIVAYVVRSPERRDTLSKLLPGRELLICDVEVPEQIEAMAREITGRGPIAGFVHSIAFADYSGGPKPFHETGRAQFLRSVDVSCYSFIALANALKDCLTRDASAVTISISTTTMASENYGFMAPIKAALDSSLAFLTKSFSRFSEIRFNAVAPGLLKTSASAGIPGYAQSFMYAEQVIPRKRAVTTDEVANTVAFLLSPRSSGITAQRLVIDAGMSINYFDASIVEKAMRD